MITLDEAQNHIKQCFELKEDQCLLSVQCNEYWLLLLCTTNVRLINIDHFLTQVWLDCCDGGKCERLWFSWDGTYTSGKIHYLNQCYLTDICLKPIAGTNYYENYGEFGMPKKKHDWVVGKTDEIIRCRRPINLITKLQKNCISKEKVIDIFNKMELRYGCRVPDSIKASQSGDLFYFNDGDCYYDESWFAIHNLTGILHELEEAEKQSLLVGLDGIDHNPPVYHKSDDSKGSWEGDFFYSPCAEDCPACKLAKKK